MLKKITILFFIIALITTGASFAMIHGMNDANCPTALFGGMPCPANIFDYAVYHVSSYNSFSGIPEAVSFFLILGLIFAGLVFIAKNFLFNLDDFYLKYGKLTIRNLNWNFYTAKIKMAKWLSFFENSPGRI